MGLLIDGQWHDQWYDTQKTKGEFVRSQAAIRNWITAEGQAGPTGEAGFKAESGRYHLYVSLACPWAHRTLIFHELKSLTEHISVSVVHPHMLENGWTFKGPEAVTDNVDIKDDLFGSDFMHQIYTRHQSDFTGRVTVPVLWDKQRDCIVSNESAEIIRMFNSAFDDITGNRRNFYPEPHQAEIDQINERVYETVNNGVYRCGFATTQEAYEKSFAPLFESLDWLDHKLSDQRYLTGAEITEADWRLFTTLLRFDPVYYAHFKCNQRRIADYPNLSNYLRDLYQQPGIAETCSIMHIKQHYFYSHDMINPHRIVPNGPELRYDAPHDRDRFDT